MTEEYTDMIKGKATAALSKVIPIENIEIYLRFYRKIDEAAWENYSDLPHDELAKIKGILDKLKKS